VSRGIEVVQTQGSGLQISILPVTNQAIVDAIVGKIEPRNCAIGTVGVAKINPSRQA
jgi:hypothetical protein